MTGTLGRLRHRLAMPPRDPEQPYRVATPLELFFDLVFVVAVAQAAHDLSHAVAEGHAGEGVLGYAAAFFAIWWAWVNWTWFASAFDIDDTAYRIATFVQMFGALVLAAGIGQVSEGHSAIAVIGYVIMRMALVSQWLRVALANPYMRPAALRFAAGVTGVQVLWIARLAVPGVWGGVAFVVLALVEMAVPWWAERHRNTPWHAHHIAERYILFTMIVLGEVVLASTAAVRTAMAGHAPAGLLILVSAGGFVIVCAMWWIYTSWPAHRLLRERGHAFRWSYTHYAIFAAAAAVGAGISVMVAYKTETGHGALGGAAAGAALAIPVAVFLLGTWFAHVRPHRPGPAVTAAHLLGAALVRRWCCRRRSPRSPSSSSR
ncbi:low temperature requirement protein A [Thermomonospora cellulosilytica]|uniref:Low temperature requirement protein LtrA n=1 Tax=Thermomonospora cellulosilytica TaxID=1411118 RepID=A0A7W3MUZ5_9ACTN|nr:low temperature requirement protein A [Thermomonospora cellulosilytica]MBA9002343.1 low temperature requirement protein LtrA [Thermomonospora cellulosilytica]